MRIDAVMAGANAYYGGTRARISGRMIVTVSNYAIKSIYIIDIIGITTRAFTVPSVNFTMTGLNVVGRANYRNTVELHGGVCASACSSRTKRYSGGESFFPNYCLRWRAAHRLRRPQLEARGSPNLGILLRIAAPRFLANMVAVPP